MPDDPIQVHQMRPIRREINDIRLQDVELGEDDVDRRSDGEPVHVPRVIPQHVRHGVLNDLMFRKRCGNHEHLAVMSFIPAPVLGRAPPGRA